VLTGLKNKVRGGKELVRKLKNQICPQNTHYNGEKLLQEYLLYVTCQD